MILYRYETRIDCSTSAYNVYYAEENHYYVVKETDASYLVMWVPHDWTEEDCKADVDRLTEHKPTLFVGRCKWMRKNATRIFACADKIAALNSFKARKAKQLKILNSRVYAAKMSYDSAETQIQNEYARIAGIKLQQCLQEANNG